MAGEAGGRRGVAPGPAVAGAVGVSAAVAWFDQNSVTYVKRPDQGKMKDVAFIKDPDGYWIEIVQPDKLTALGR